MIQTEGKNISQTRNYGIDILRNLSMLFVVILHILGDGGLLEAVEGQPVNYGTLKVLHIAAMCAVNCYGLVSGYVGYRSKFRLSNIVTMWLQVFLYSAGMSVIGCLLRPGILSVNQLISSFMPVIFSTYWYFTAYFVLFFTMPLLNLAIERLPRRQFALCLGVLLFLVTVCQQTVVVQDIFRTNKGYSYLWLALLYCTGGYLGKYWSEFKKPLASLLGYIACIAVCWAGHLLLRHFGMEEEKRLEAYNSPFMFLEGVMLLLLFANVKVPAWLKKVTAILAPASFGVYLIHTHPVLWNNYWKGAFQGLGKHLIWAQILLVIGMASTVYLICSGIDLVRNSLFSRLKIKKRLSQLEEKVILKNGGNT